MSFGVIGLVYKAHPNNCRHECTPAKAKALPHEGTCHMLGATLLLSLEPFSLFAHGTVKH